MKWVKKIMKLVGWSLLGLVIIYLFFLRTFLMHWGSSSSERNRYYPGDSIVANPATITTIAVTINKPPSAIWPWIAQMGLNKAGFYSYTRLENMFGCNLHNADVIHPEWQNTKEGDIESVCEAAVKKQMSGWMVAIVATNKAFVYKAINDSTWTMGYYIDSIDINHSRLITRMRYVSPRKFWEYITDKVWLEWAHCIMQRGSIKGIKIRAERNE